MNPSILIIGCGSIGERHLRCFQKTARCSVTACEPNPTLATTMAERYGVPVFHSLDTALASATFDAAVVCTPAHIHLPITQQLLALGLHVLIEKPLAIDLSQVPATRTSIEQADRFVAVAYVYHLMPWLAEARQYLLQGSLGQPLHVTSTSGQHFPTFRPAYREIYYARHDLGGGAIQDALTHVVNAVEWLIGPCTRLFCDAAHLALDGVTVEDTVNVSARHGDILAAYSINQFQAPNENTFQIHCQHGSLKIEVHERRWGFLKNSETDWTWHVTPPLERDDLFIAQANAFLDGMADLPHPLCSFEEAVQTLRFNEAALRSATTQLPVILA